MITHEKYIYAHVCTQIVGTCDHLLFCKIVDFDYRVCEKVTGLKNNMGILKSVLGDS
jgi:hypothetical protein